MAKPYVIDLDGNLIGFRRRNPLKRRSMTDSNGRYGRLRVSPLGVQVGNQPYLPLKFKASRAISVRHCRGS